MPIGVKREAKIIASLLAGWLGATVATTLHVVVWMYHPPLNSDVGFRAASLLLGFPTFGGAPYEIHLYNAGIWCLWGAALYSLTMRICFGRISMVRILAIYAVGMACIAVGERLVAHGTIDKTLLGNGLLIAYAVVGLFGIRDWPARTSALARPHASSEA